LLKTLYIANETIYISLLDPVVLKKKHCSLTFPTTRIGYTSDINTPMATTTTHVAATATSHGAFPACTTAVPGKYGQVPLDACNSSYNAIPEFIPAVVVSVLFGTLTLIHIIEAVVYKKVSSADRSITNTMICVSAF
jgi:hypothetical protein